MTNLEALKAKAEDCYEDWIAVNPFGDRVEQAWAENRRTRYFKAQAAFDAANI